MAEVKHTPGPWETADEFGPSATGRLVQKTGGNLICACTGYFGRDETLANARLIAAAPDLFAALKAVASDECVHGAFDMARAAIAKAEGRT